MSLPRLELHFRPTEGTINDSRRLVKQLIERALGDTDTAERIALAAHELLENALKYSLDGNTVFSVDVSPAREIVVETRHPASPERRLGIGRVFEEMARYSCAQSYYQFTMERTLTMASGSGLGLARIWAECEMPLRLACEGDEVRIIASLALKDSAKGSFS